MEFQVGDRVKIEGILEVNNTSLIFPLKLVVSSSREYISLTKDGNIYINQKDSIIELVERPKQKVKRYNVLFQNESKKFKVSLSEFSNKVDFELSNPNLKFIQLIQESEQEFEE